VCDLPVTYCIIAAAAPARRMSNDVYFDGAEAIYQLLKTNWAGLDSSLYPAVALAIEKEVTFVVKNTGGSCAHRVLRSRVEYMLLVLHNIASCVRCLEILSDATFGLLYDLLKCITVDMMHGDVSEDDKSEVSDSCMTESNAAMFCGCDGALHRDSCGYLAAEDSLPPSRTRWTQMCSTTLACLLVKILQQVLVHIIFRYSVFQTITTGIFVRLHHKEQVSK
jgi:hypothetical protein